MAFWILSGHAGSSRSETETFQANDPYFECPDKLFWCKVPSFLKRLLTPAERQVNLQWTKLLQPPSISSPSEDISGSIKIARILAGWLIKIHRAKHSQTSFKFLEQKVLKMWEYFGAKLHIIKRVIFAKKIFGNFADVCRNHQNTEFCNKVLTSAKFQFFFGKMILLMMCYFGLNFMFIP